MLSYVIGGHGRIGAALRQRLAAAALPFEWTSRRDDDQETRWFLDLAEPVSAFPWGDCEAGSVLYIVAAANGFQACEGRQHAYRINVDAPAAIARLAARQGAHVVFISTDSVEWALHMAYPMQKALAETHIQHAGGAIVRPARVSEEMAADFCDWLIGIGAMRAAGVFRWP